MAVLRPSNGNPPALNGRVMIDTVRGRVRVRAWPKKRGTPKSPLVREQNDWFRTANKLSKLAAGTQQAIAIEATAKSGLYPRDLILKAISGGIADLRLPDGQIITYRRYEVWRVTFNGTRVARAANFGVAGSTVTNIPWDDVPLNPAGMWSAADPAYLTIPPGVEVVDFTAGIREFSNSGNRVALWIAQVGGDRIAQVNLETGFEEACSLSTGPLNVSPGQQYVCQVFANGGITLRGGSGTFFAAHIVGTS